MIVTLLTEHHLEFLSLKGGCRGSSESTHVKMPHSWKSHALALNIKESEQLKSASKVLHNVVSNQFVHAVWSASLLFAVCGAQWLS